MQKRIELVHEWIKKAEHDLGMAELAMKHQPEFRDSICFHCQQAAEKYLKAYLVYHDAEFKKSHSLSYLLDLVSEITPVTPDEYDMGDILEEYGVAIRYPDSRDPSLEDAKDAIEAAIKIKVFILNVFRNEGFRIMKVQQHE